MNRNWIVIAKFPVKGGEGGSDSIPVEPLNRLFYAESNSPSQTKIRLSGRPEIKDAIKIFLEALPDTYDKNGATELVKEAVEEIFE